MTISLDQAKSLASKAVSALGAASADEFALIEDRIVETDNGWVFFYNTREFIETGDLITALAGNGPIFVHKCGNIKELPSSIDWEEAIKSF